MARPDKKNRASVLLKKKQHVAYITLNRPEVLNTISREMLERLSALFDDISSDEGIKAVIITGAGPKAFSAGADIHYLNQASPLEIRDLARLAVAVNRRIEASGKVVIAAINGYALGGGLELAEACMLRVAVSTAKLGHPEVRIGAVAGWGGTTRLARLIGKGRAAELLLTGKMISAEEAISIGLVNRVTEPDNLIAEAEGLIHEICSQSPHAARMTWEAMHRGLDMSIDESSDLGADYFGLIASTEDFREGTRAFLGKYPPAFKGK
jgi:enoyl-CoA hydratase